MTIAERLLWGSRGVVELFLGIRQLLGLAGIGLALAACVYYVLGTAGWLWSLRDGITGGESQNGLVLILAALLFSGIRGRSGPPRNSKMPMLANVDLVTTVVSTCCPTSTARGHLPAVGAFWDSLSGRGRAR